MTAERLIPESATVQAQLFSQEPENIPDGVYILIDDLFFIRRLTDKLKVAVPAGALNQAREMVVDSLRQIFGRENLLIISAEERRDKLRSLVKKIEEEDPSVLTVSLDPDYYDDEDRCAYLHVNRIVDRTGRKLGRGPRPGYPSLKLQVNQLASYTQMVGKSKVRLVDDVITQGGTAEFVINELQERGLRVDGVVAGTMKRSTAAIFAKKQIQAAAVFFYEHLRGSVASRDVIPGIPRGGHAIGALDNTHGYMPLAEKHGVVFRAPYSAVPPEIDFIRTSEWADIPEEHTLNFSVMCWQAARDLHEAILSEYGNRSITLGHLQRLESQVAFPGPPTADIQAGGVDRSVEFIQILTDTLKVVSKHRNKHVQPT